MAATHFSGPVISAAGFDGILGDTTPAAATVTSLTNTGAETVTGVFSGGNGTAAAPEFTFTADPDTGVYRAAANSLGFAANGVSVGTADVNGFNGILGGTTPAAATVTTLTASGVVSLANGTSAAPELNFTNSTTTGLYRSASNVMGIAVNGAAVGTWDLNGVNAAIGGTTPAAASVTTLTSTGTQDLQGAVIALDNFTDSLTAHAGGTQAAALGLTTVVNRITTVGTAADSVKLPAPTKVGQLHIVINSAATNSMQVFGSGTDTINGIATATGVAQAAGITALYVATSTGAAAKWFRLLSA